jgi:transposase-like protein
MGARFWLKPASTSLDLPAISDLSEEEARMLLAEMRWGSATEQVCPDCGVIDSHYVIRTRRQWRCKHCKFTFSVTSRTPFADHKISHKKLLIALFIFTVHQKGQAALEVKRLIKGDYRTWFTLLHKTREALTKTVPAVKLKGLVEMDGSHMSGRPRKGRKTKFKRQHRIKASGTANKFHPNRRIIIVVRENDQMGLGAGRTVVEVVRTESGMVVEALAEKWIEPGATVSTDESPAYGQFGNKGYTHQSVNHRVEFSTDMGVNENQAESLFARVKRAEKGIYHRITPHYLIDYANEMAWREDVRRMDTGTQLKNLVFRVFSAGLSIDWRGYSHGHRRLEEQVFAP